MSEPESKPKSVSEIDDDETDAAEEQRDIQEQIIETGAVTPTKGKYVIHCLTIVGQVEGHYILPPQNKTTKYEHVIPQLVAIQENPEIQGLIIILNTVGGDVEAGLAIAELVSGMKKPTVSLVLGGGHSIGVPLAVSARQSFIVPSATMTIHPVRMNGVVLGVPQTLSYFDKMQERIVRFVEENSHISGEKFRELMMNTGELVMDVGTVLDGEQAVETGLIDRLGGLSDAINCLYDMIEAEQAEKEAENTEADENAENSDDQNMLPDFSPLPASPRGIAQLLQNEHRKNAAKPVTVKPATPKPHRAASVARIPSLRERQKRTARLATSRLATASLATASLTSAKLDGANTAATSINRNMARPVSHSINGNGGDICDVNPFGHVSPYAD